MPLCTLHLVSLDGGPTRTRSFLSSLIAALPKTENDPVLLLAGTPQRWVIVPSRDSAGISDLRSTDWHAVVLLKGEQGLPAQTRTHVKEEWTVIVGVPSRVVSGFAARNADFLRPKTDPIPLTGSLDRPRLSESQQGLEATPELIEWAKGYDEERKGTRGEETRAVSMLNLLKFKAGKKGTYQEYGKAFGESIGSKRGGVAKVVGAVTTPKDGDWEEIAIAHYPTAVHFADMAASEDYQLVNHEHRLPSLEDTCILCLREVDLDRDLAGVGADVGTGAGRSWETGKAKL